MARLSNAFLQYSDDAGKPISEGKLYFYDSGTTNLRNTYVDSGLSIPNANPLLLDGAGRVNSPFLDGNYRVILTDKDDNQIREIDPVQGSLSDSQWADWSITTTYGITDIVRASNGNYYISLTGSNLGNDPVSSPINWSQISFVTVWNVNETYSMDDNVFESGTQYKSLVDNNLGNLPSTSPAEWGVPTGGVVAGNPVSVLTNDVPYLEAGNDLSDVSDAPTARTNLDVYSKAESDNGRKNLLMNGDFSVWQRGNTFNGIGYTADRWYSGTSANQVDRTAGTGTEPESLTISNTVTHDINQYIELPAVGTAGAFKQGSTVTASMLVKGTVGEDMTIEMRFSEGSSGSSGTLWTPVDSITHTGTGNWERVSTTFTVDQVPSGTDIAARLQLTFFNTTGATQIAEAQVETGSVATPFTYRPVGEELALCQRYYEASDAGVVYDCFPIAEGSVTRRANFPYNVKKRIEPAVTFIGVSTNWAIGPTGSGSSSLYVGGTSTGVNFGTFFTGFTADAEL